MQPLFLMLCMLKSKNISKFHITYISKHNSNREKQVILLMIPNSEKWHC